MKKKVLKAMKAAAKSLKQGGHVVFEKVKGDVLLAANPNAMCNGEPVNKDKFYKRQAIKPTSNYRAVKKYFKQPENRKQLHQLVRP